jgi:hypothetical protein
MTLVMENTMDGAREKHVPVIEKTDEGYMVVSDRLPTPTFPLLNGLLADVMPGTVSETVREAGL